VSDEAEDRDGTGEEVPEQGEQQDAAWSEPASGPRWSEIASEASLGAPGGAGVDPGPTDPSTTDPGTTDPGATPGSEPPPATEAARSRRPSSLRSGPVSTDVPRRTPAAPQPGAGSNNPVSEPTQAGRSGQMPSADGSLLDKAPVKKLQAFVKERPEAGLGLAFIGGLLIATILRRLAR